MDKSAETHGAVAEQHQLVTMYVNQQLVGLPIRAVQDVFLIQKVTPVPRASACVVGLVNLRGRVVTLLDLATLVGYPPQPLREGMMAVGVIWKDEAFGLVIERIGDVISVDDGVKDTAVGKMDAKLAARASAIHKTAGGLVIELDVDGLLGSSNAKAA
jgi:purine-binding chemotaxis protein CheW